VPNRPSLPVPAAMLGRWPTVGLRDAAFLLLAALAVAWLWQPLSTVIMLSLDHGEYEHYSHIILIPMVSLVLIYFRRSTVFAQAEYAPVWGGGLVLAGVTLSCIARIGPVTDPDRAYVSVAMLALVVLCAGAFLLCYGAKAFRAAAFPLAFLLFTVPLPPFLLHQVIVLLQKGSAEMTYVIFNLLGVPVYREGFRFELPRLAIEVAEECSGIRSSMALMVTGLLASHMLLRTTWARAALMTAILPIAIVKNAVRIVVLSLLAIHVDMGFISGKLHQRGGIPLFFVTLLVVGAVVWLLQRLEARGAHRAAASHPAGSA
jgi:exosortase